MDRVIRSNDEVSRRVRIENEFGKWSRSQSLMQFAHVGRMNEYRMAVRVLMAEVSVGRVQGRPRFGWMDDVKAALGS